jgi:hypothetical protein
VLKWKDGQINFSVTEEPDSTFQVQFNFHRSSANIDELVGWLSVPVADLKGEVKRVLLNCMQIKMEDTVYATANAKA